MQFKRYDTKLFFLAILIGVITAGVCLPFRFVLSEIGHLREWYFQSKQPWYIQVAIPIAIYILMLLVHLMVRKFPLSQGSGMPQTKALLNGRLQYNTPWQSFFVKFFGGIMSIGSGLSLGREGSSVQMGSLVGDWITKIFHVSTGRRKHLIAAGAGAGISAAFTAPLASSILILESLEKFYMPFTAITTLLAGLAAGVLAIFFFPNDIYHSIMVKAPDLNLLTLLMVYAAMATFFSLFGKLFSFLLIRGREYYMKVKMKPFIKIFFVAGVTYLIGLYFPTLVGGDQGFLISESNSTQTSIFVLLGVILLITSFTILSNSVQFPGGIFLPMMTVGGLSGKFFCLILIELDIVTISSIGYFVLIGMSAGFISVFRTPLTGFILISEMTGHYELFFPTLAVGILTYYFTELLKVEPMDDILYRLMLQNISGDYPKRMIVNLDVEENSYLDGKTPATLQLPSRCIIVALYRDNSVYRFVEGVSIKPGDQLDIEIDSQDLEKIYQPLASMAFS